MARPSPVKRKEKRTEVGDAIEASVNRVSDTINKGLGNMIGGVIEKIKLRGKPGSGTHTATQTGVTAKLKKKYGTKGLAANREY